MSFTTERCSHAEQEGDHTSVAASARLAIRAFREEARYSQESFARHAGLDRSYFGAVERGIFNLTFEFLVRIAAG